MEVKIWGTITAARPTKTGSTVRVAVLDGDRIAIVLVPANAVSLGFKPGEELDGLLVNVSAGKRADGSYDGSTVYFAVEGWPAKAAPVGSAKA